MGLMTRVGSVTLTSRLPEIQAAIQRESAIRVREMAAVVRTETLRVLSGERHGRFYRIPGTHRERRSGAARFRKAQVPKGGYPAGMGIGAASLLSTGTGVKGRRGFYRASAPGEAPAQRLSDLRKSIRMKVRTNRETATAWVGSGMDKAVWLQKGTKKMKPRPWLDVAFDNMRSKLHSIGTREIPGL